jgi:MarR family transcriptional regulator for hemolysin
MTGPPRTPPLGLALARAAGAVGRAFDQALAAAGGSRPQWLILLSLRAGRAGNQEQLAAAVGIRGATLTHHLDALEEEGLVTRRRSPANRREHLVSLTPRGEEAFLRLRGAAAAFDRRLRGDLSDGEVARLTAVLARLQSNVEA